MIDRISDLILLGLFKRGLCIYFIEFDLQTFQMQ